MILKSGKEYYCKDGFVQTSFSGKVVVDGVSYNIKNGVVQ
jgi:hypothetical protein